MAYTPGQIRVFRQKDLRLHKSGIIKSHVENTGKLPTSEFLDEALRLIYVDTTFQNGLLDELVDNDDFQLPETIGKKAVYVIKNAETTIPSDES